MLEVIASRFREAGLTATDAELFAKSTLRDLDAQGVVKKVDRELPEIPKLMLDTNGTYHLVRTIDYECHLCQVIQQEMLKAGYVATESILKGVRDDN